MTHTLEAPTTQRMPRAAPSWATHRPPAPADDADLDTGFIALQAALRASGGLMRSNPLAALLARQPGGSSLDLARAIAAGQVFSFYWHDSAWVPMFQFDRDTLAQRPAAGQVLAELVGALDGWDLAGWFARPNGWLAQQRPLDLLDRALPEVLHAARADRFLLAG